MMRTIIEVYSNEGDPYLSGEYLSRASWNRWNAEFTGWERVFQTERTWGSSAGNMKECSCWWADTWFQTSRLKEGHAE